MMTEWHARYRGPGVMVYWHVEKKQLCIYSQLTTCSASEVAAMLQGLLHHDTDAEVESNVTDTSAQALGTTEPINDPVDQIRRLADLRDSGAITAFW